MKLYLDKEADKRKHSAGQRRPNQQGSRHSGLRSFVVFLILSFCFWFLQSMQSDMIRRIHIPISHGVMHANRGVSERIPDYIELEIQDKGIEHLRYALDEPDTIYLKVISEKLRGEFIGISARDLQSEINTRLSSSAKVLQQSFQELRIALYERINKRVPLLMNDQIRSADGYIATEVALSPDSITIYGEAKVLQNIHNISLTSWGNDRITESVVRILAPRLPEGVYSNLSQVQVSASVDELTEKSFELPITIRNIPSTNRLVLLPSKATVKLTIPRSYYTITTPDSLAISVDYEQVSQGGDSDLPSNQLPIALSKAPQWVVSTSIHPSYIQYISEQ